MSKDLTDVDAFTSPIHVPEGTDLRNQAAEDVELIAQRLANRTHFLNLRTAKLAVANTFTAQQTVNFPSASTPLLDSTTDANDHPSSGSNIWKLIDRFKMNDGTFIRRYVGDATNQWIITSNAVWDPASGAQSWSQDSGAKVSTALWAHGNVLAWFNKAAGASPWGNNSWDASGLFQTGGSVTVGDDLTVGDDATINGDLSVTGNAAIPNVSGSVTVAGNLTAATLDSLGDLFAADDVIATDEFQYAAPPSRTRFLELFDSFGEGALSFGGGTFHIDFSAGAKVQLWPIRLPQGATLTAVQLVCNKASTGAADFRVYRKQGYSWPGTMPNDFQLGSTDTETGSGDQMLEVTGLSQAISNNSVQCFAQFTSGDSGDAVYGLRVTFTDPGPRNH